jgi:HD-GYP domain-containing protein (c-di-GMP phosphodiesterase class II)
MMQGLSINSEDDILELMKYCEFVYVDDGLSKGPEQKSTPIKLSDSKQQFKQIFTNKKPRIYKDSNSFEDEINKAGGAISKLSEAISTRFSSLTKQDSININEIRSSVEPMVDSIIRNPDACLWLTRLKNLDNYTYQHALSAAVWAVALGRHLGLPKSDLSDLSVGVSLFDIGKMRIPERVLNKKDRLNETELKLIRCHVGLGLKMLENSEGMNHNIFEIVAHHHERHDGSGYPSGLSGNEIPPLARIAAIADCYDAITSQRPYAQAISPGTAVNRLYEWRGRDFQTEIVEEFIQAIGIYPAGTLVELSDGSVGVVLAEYRTRRLRPKIIQLLDNNKHPLHTVKVIDLIQTTHDPEGNPLEIIDSLEPYSYGIDLNKLNVYQCS